MTVSFPARLNVVTVGAVEWRRDRSRPVLERSPTAVTEKKTAPSVSESAVSCGNGQTAKIAAM
jgi:hypothetical protein